MLGEYVGDCVLVTSDEFDGDSVGTAVGKVTAVSVSLVGGDKVGGTVCVSVDVELFVSSSSTITESVSM